MMIGYARVSTDEQNLDLQQYALKEAGCETVFCDKASGVRTDRKGLAKAMRQCSKGDVLVVWKLDRLGRSLLGLVGLVEKLKVRGIGLRVLTGQGAMIDTTRPEGRMVFGIFASLAEFERELISERTRAGMAAAKMGGVHCGRPRKLSARDIAGVRCRLSQNEKVSIIAASLGVHVTTLRRYMAEKT